MARKARKQGNMTASPSTAVKKEPTTFLSLPPELRLQVYGYLLPDIDTWAMEPSRPLRKNGEKASTAFMAANRQIHEEAAALLYGTGQITAIITSDHVVLLNMKVPLDTIRMTSTLSAVRQISDLRLLIRARDNIAVCDVQDATFAFLSHLQDAEHHLRNVDVSIDIGSFEHDWFHALSSNAAARYGRIERLRVSPPFLSDPLKILHNVKDGRKKGKVTLRFVGETGNPWREIPRTVRALLQGNAPVLDYRPFSRYYDILRPIETKIRKFIHAHKSTLSVGASNKPLSRMAIYRIHGQVAEFRKSHEALSLDIKDYIASRSLNISSETEEYDLRELCYLLEELDTMLPSADTDVSFLGYNESDRKLAEWQSGRADRRLAKTAAKRKREDSDDEGDSDADGNGSVVNEQAPKT